MKASQWPPDYGDAALKRIRRLEYNKKRPESVEAAKLFYKDNPTAFINDLCITYNPRNAAPIPKNIPFLTFRRQDEFIQFLQSCLEDKESGLVEKARDIGATWLCCAFSVWLWLFHEGSNVGWGSRKEDLVDEIGNPDSIFEKIRMIIRALPVAYLPAGFNTNKHMPYMKVINPENGSVIAGESGDNIGRGGRSTIYFKDESAHYEHPEKIEAALGDNTDVQIDISSVNGTANVFYNRRMAGEIWTPTCDKIVGKTRVFIFEWRDHPAKTEEWYEKRRKKAEAEGLLHLFAQEVDRDYAASVQGMIISPKWVKAARDAHIKLGIPYSGEKVAAQDVADGGKDKHALAHRHGVILKFADHWAEGDGGDAARKAIPLCMFAGVGELYYDCIGVGASFKTESNRLKDIGKVPDSLRICKWDASASPLDKDVNLIPSDPESPTNDDFFENLKIQAWWSLRTRFEKTYKAITFGIKYPWEELISLPSTLENIHIIERELSQAVIKHNSAGKILVNKTPDGSKSPNLADAIVMCYHPTREISILDVID